MTTDHPTHAFLCRQIAGRLDSGPWTCMDHWTVKQRNYWGASSGDDWYYLLAWCSSCRMHHQQRR